MKRVLFALFLLSAPGWAQDKPPERLLISLKYINPSQLQNLIHPYGVNFNFNEEMKVITLSGPSDAVDAAAAMIRQLDVAPKDIELTVYYMVGSAGEYDNLGSVPPKELEPVVAQLKNAFTFKNYRLLDVLVLRSRTGQQASSSANLGTVNAANGNVQPIIGQFGMRSATLAPDGSTVRLDGMKLNLRWPAAGTYLDLSLNTDVDIKEGQKVVVGRLGITHDQALFLVLTAKVVN